jgi:Cdc6-like AAA superfamily ATPase
MIGNTSAQQSVDNASSLLADAPTTRDLLGYRQMVAPVVARISQSNLDSTPLTIGIYGPWGSGKTSFLRMVNDDLKKTGIHPIWFNAWKYDREDNLWSALLQTVLDQAKISGSYGRRLWVRFQLWRSTLSLRAGSWELFKRIGAAFLRILLFLLALYLLVSLPHYPTSLIGRVDSLRNLAPQVSTPAVTVVARVALALILIVLAKPESLLKLLDARLGIDFAQSLPRSNGDTESLPARWRLRLHP